jgi:hypothetical protein
MAIMAMAFIGGTVKGSKFFFIRLLLLRVVEIDSSVICQTHDRSTASSKTIPPLNAI